MDSLLTSLNIQTVNPGAYSGNIWCSKKGEPTLHSMNPADESLLASVSGATMEEYDHLVSNAQAAFQMWRMVPAPKRGEVIREIGLLLREQKTILGQLVSLEMGKSIQEGEGEVQEMIDMADFAVGQSRMLYGNTMHSERFKHRMYEQWHPYGVVGIISAFNFPVAVWAWNAFLAIICGNTVVWKPSSKTPLSAIAVQHICIEVLNKMQLPALFTLCIPKNHEVTEAFVSDKRIGLLSFTGSTEVGQGVAAKVAQRLGRSILELGGNNAMVIDETASLKLAIPALVFGAVGTAGQRCTTTRRAIVHHSLCDTLIQQLKQAYQQIKIGDPLNAQNHMGPLIDMEAVNLFKDTIHQIKKEGGTIIFGGEILDMKGCFVQPTLVTSIQPTSKLIQQERFVPILYIIPYQEIEEAIAIQNNVPQGLSSAIFTQDLAHAELFLSALGSDCGIANVNIGTSGAEIGGAFGGEKETGGGREAGSDAWKAYMRRQTNTINWGDTLPLAQGIRFDL